MLRKRIIWLSIGVLFSVAFRARSDELAKQNFFETRIRPVLVERCYECHSTQAEEVEASLYLDSRGGTRSGGDTGPAVVPGEPGKSLLLQAIRYEDVEMPPDQRLPDHVIDDFAKWIAEGAYDPRTQRIGPREPDYTEARQHWAFRPIVDSPLPTVKQRAWPKTGLDHFILAELERRDIDPSAPASRAKLVRRLYFDLLGLPPTPAQIQAFVGATSPSAYEELVDRLLADPRYGERWGQHWLDVVRYAETEGFEYDRLLPGAWRYRDYVIDSLNQDKSYDRFVMEQLAGDEVAQDSAVGENQVMKIAAGFHRLGTVRRNAGNQKVASSRNEVLTERTDIVGTVFLGLTVGCARCHDHKFDAIPQQDYYRLQAYFAGTQEHNQVIAPAEEYAQWRAKTDRIQAEIDTFKERLDSQTGEEEAATRERIAELTSTLPAALPTLCSITNDPDDTTPVHLLRRGNPDQPTTPVGMRPLGVLVSKDRPELPISTTAPRTRLAEWINGPNHPLTTRVIVNRIWQFHFGNGLVRTPNDFGTNGRTPSHPKLLDWLARRFTSSGQSLKSLHRLIVLSSTYRQSGPGASHERATQIDPENELLWCFPRRRLSSEEIRDTMLLLSGELCNEQGGPSVTLPVDEQLVEQLYKASQWVISPVRQHGRRSIYLLAKRNLRLPFMEVFDQPTAQTSCACREQTTHAPQALELLNGGTSNRLSSAFARRIRSDAGDDVDQQIALAYELAAGRLPTHEEQALAREFVSAVSLEEFALALFNLNAFLYVD